MSLRVIGYLNGRRIVQDEGPASAHLTGNGAANVGHMLPSRVTPILRTNAELRNEARRREREAG